MRRILFIGQAMPRHKRDPHDWPTLNAWLYSLGITHAEIVANFSYSALVDYFPGSKAGSHLVPTREQIAKDRDRLLATIRNFNPDVVVPIGKLSIGYCLGLDNVLLAAHIGKIFRADPYGALGRSLLIVPLPHPSGASTWRHKPVNKQLLQNAMTLLKQALT